MGHLRRCAPFFLFALMAALTSDAAGGNERIKDLLKAKRRAAEDAYRVHFKNFQRETNYLNTELSYQWSKRIMETEIEITPQKEARVNILKGHQQRLVTMNEIVEKRLKSGLSENTREQMQYYLKEAETWLVVAEIK